MPFGKLVDCKVDHGPSGLSHRALSLEFLCDGWSHRNPGVGTPVLHDGRQFRRMRPTKPETNHSVVWDAVETAVDLALRRRASEVTIEIVSSLVWKQLTGSSRAIASSSRRDAVRKKASAIPKVTWKLVEAPFYVSGDVLATTRALRRVAPRRFTSWPMFMNP